MSSYEAWHQIRSRKEFTVTIRHLELLRRMWVGWNHVEFGAPEIDPKRPYGNSDVLCDIAEIIFEPEIMSWDDETREQWIGNHEAELTLLHAETALALQICLRQGTFRSGRYLDEGWPRYWVPVEEEMPSAPAGRAVEGRTEPDAIRYTPEASEAVREWLGDAYIGMDGPAEEGDEPRLWFRCGHVYCWKGRDWAAPGEWLVRQRDGDVAAMSDEDYRNAG